MLVIPAAGPAENHVPDTSLRPGALSSGPHPETPMLAIRSAVKQTYLRAADHALLDEIMQKYGVRAITGG